MIKIDERKLRQPRDSRGGRSPVKITMAAETREKISQIAGIHPGGHLSAFTDWANRILLYIIGVGNAQELQEEARTLITMFRDIAGTEENATALGNAANRLEVLVIALWAFFGELDDSPNYHIHQEVANDMIEGFADD